MSCIVNNKIKATCKTLKALPNFSPGLYFQTDHFSSPRDFLDHDDEVKSPKIRFFIKLPVFIKQHCDGFF